MNEATVEDKVLAFLSASTNGVFNISEISRAISKAPPTVSKAVNILQAENKVKIVNKRSMKLISLVKV